MQPAQALLRLWDEFYTNLNQEEIIDGCKRRQEKAQRALYQTFAPKMFGVCLRYARDRSEAEDLLQEGFVKIFDRIGQFDGKGSLEGWIRRVMVHNAIDWLRKQRYIRQETELDAADGSFADDLPDTLSLEYLYKIVQELPPGYRFVFNLFAIEGYSHAEIAERLGVTESSSRSQYTRAKAALQKRIHEDHMDQSLHQNPYRHVVGE